MLACACCTLLPSLFPSPHRPRANFFYGNSPRVSLQYYVLLHKIFLRTVHGRELHFEKFLSPGCFPDKVRVPWNPTGPPSGPLQDPPRTPQMHPPPPTHPTPSNDNVSKRFHPFLPPPGSPLDPPGPPQTHPTPPHILPYTPLCLNRQSF